MRPHHLNTRSRKGLRGQLFMGVLTVALTSSCSAPLESSPQEPLLVGGAVVTDETDFPATVGLYVKGALCTGSKIGSHHILTAGHCVTDDRGQRRIADGDDFSIFTFNTVSVPPVREHQERRVVAQKVHLHPEFRAPHPGPDDIAVIITAMPLDGIPAVDLDFEPKDFGTPVFVAGYGCEHGRNQPTTASPRLKFATSQTATPNTALTDLKEQPWFRFPLSNRHRRILKDNSMHVLRGAAAGSLFSTCPGDSGGPLLLGTHSPKKAPLIGLTSISANGGGNLARWSFFVKLERHKSWVTTILNEESR